MMKIDDDLMRRTINIFTSLSIYAFHFCSIYKNVSKIFFYSQVHRLIFLPFIENNHCDQICYLLFHRFKQMPKRRVLKNRNEEEQEQPQPHQLEHVEEEEKQRSSTTDEPRPPRKITQNVRKGKGQQREYHYLTTVKSYEELDKFRFQNYCRFDNSNKRLHQAFNTIVLPCSRKRSRNKCDFELKALRPDLESGKIHVYSFSQHNHPLESEAKRSQCRKSKDLMGDENPPMIYCTSDNIEWTFRQTLPDYDTFNKFRLKNKCEYGNRRACYNRLRIRCHCYRRKCKDDICKFMLLVLKTTKRRYHVYSYGEHNHPIQKIKKRQKSARGKQKSRQEQMEDADEEGEVPMPMEEEQEDEPIEREQHAEDIAQPEQDEQMSTEEEEYSEKCRRRLQSNLHKYDMVRTKKWMKRIDQAEIGRIIAEMDIRNVANLMSMADTDIGIFEETLSFWLPWMKKAVHKRRAELVEFVMEFKKLRKVESMPDKLKGKIQKMLGQWREIEAQKVMVPEETTSDDEN